MTKVGILALQGAVESHARLLRQVGASPVEVRTPADLAEADALVIPGGESTTISHLLGRNELFEPIADRLAAGMPAMGTCAGMILLAAQVLDGRPDQQCFGAIDIDVRRNAYGRQVDSFEADLDLALDPQVHHVHAVFIRAPVVERVGPGVDVLATVDGQPVCCRQGPVLVTAFHPELAGDPRIHEAFLALASAARPGPG